MGIFQSNVKSVTDSVSRNNREYDLHSDNFSVTYGVNVLFDYTHVIHITLTPMSFSCNCYTLLYNSYTHLQTLHTHVLCHSNTESVLYPSMAENIIYYKTTSLSHRTWFQFFLLHSICLSLCYMPAAPMLIVLFTPWWQNIMNYFYFL